jgi:outer membrane protein OmpA-like peptidoglycan-associated protein
LKRSTILIFGLFSTSFAYTASANEVAFTCDYQLGTGTGARREKIGSVAVAIDVKKKSARIDFGKGWFKTNTLQVHGTNVKEMPPSTSGNKLGLFYFDLSANSGGFSGEGFHEFFSTCVQDNTVRSTDNAPDKSGTVAGHADHRKQATESATATETTVAPRASARAVTQYYGRTASPAHPAWAAEATINSAYRKLATQSAAAPAAANEPAPPRTGGKAITQYYGRSASPAHPAWAAEATINPAYRKLATQSATAPAAADEPAPPRTGGKAITQYYGRPASPAHPAWNAEATIDPAYRKLATENEPASPQTGEKAITEYYGRSASPENPAWAAKAAINPAHPKQATQSAAAPAIANEPAPPQTGEKAVTEYYGRSASPENPAWAAEATMNIDDDRNTLPANDTSAKSPDTIAALEAPKASCSGALDAAARTADLYFSNASFVLGSQSKAGLKKIAKAITDCGNVAVEVGGYTDDWGNPDYNKTLSQLRANAVVDYLVKEGVDSSKLKAVGYGQERPIATNRTPAGRRLNRRVEFRIAGP